MISNLVYEMTMVNAGDTRRICHALKVHAFSKYIAEREGADTLTRQVTEAAAVLHDIAIRNCEANFGKCSGKLQEQYGPDIARPLLEKYTDDAALIDRVLYLIAHHHTYDNINELDYQILIEADFLVNTEEGDLSVQAFESVVDRYFKTKTGKTLADTMFGISNTR